MIRLKDGKKAVEIDMVVWEENGYSPDWSIDFFAAAYDEKSDYYIVPDVDYCLDQAEDWKNGLGDYDNQFGELREVFVYELKNAK